ncbi:MAG: hypothetical protein VYA46_00325 [Verrucomicrobiota bacterium]|nr:hypothetical protein [Verrucomicrobiota bacterium]
MHNYPTLLFLCTSFTLFACPLQAQKKPPVPTADEEKIVPQWQKDFEEIDPGKKKAFRKHMIEASRLFNQKRIIESLNEIAEAQRIFPDDPHSINLVGACHVEFRNFKKARAAFEAALEKQGDYLKDIKELQGDARKRRIRPVLNILFNLAEMDFVTREWKSCHERIEKILPDMDPANVAMIRLIEFKHFLCKLKMGQVDEARLLANKYDYLDDYPYYYYTNAAISYHDGKESEAERWRASARRVFRRAATLAPWEDTMIEVGYVKSFYGGTSEAGD